MRTENRWPDPWEAAQIPPPRGRLARAWMAARIRWLALTARRDNLGRNQRSYGASNG
jgi:hypothetical protein